LFGSNSLVITAPLRVGARAQRAAAVSGMMAAYRSSMRAGADELLNLVFSFDRDADAAAAVPDANVTGACCCRPRVTFRPPESFVEVSQMFTVSPAALAGTDAQGHCREYGRGRREHQGAQSAPRGVPSATAQTPAEGQDAGRPGAGQILIADLTMSLDNVLAVPEPPRQHPWVLISGLRFPSRSPALAASLDREAAKPPALDRLRGPGDRALRRPAHDIGWERGLPSSTWADPRLQRAMPQPLDIDPAEVAKRRGK